MGTASELVVKVTYGYLVLRRLDGASRGKLTGA